MDAFERFGRELVKAGRRRRRAERRARRGRQLDRRLAFTLLAVIAVGAISAGAGLLGSGGPGSTEVAQAARLLAIARAATAASPACRPPTPGRSVFLPTGIARKRTAKLLAPLRSPQTPQEHKLASTLSDLRLAGAPLQVLGGSVRLVSGQAGASATLVVLRRLPAGSTHSEPILCAHLELLDARRLGRGSNPAVRARVRTILAAGLAFRPGPEEIYACFSYRAHDTPWLRESFGRFAQLGVLTAYRLGGRAGALVRVEGIVPDGIVSAELTASGGAPVALAVDHNLISTTLHAAPAAILTIVLHDRSGASRRQQVSVS